MDHGTNAMDILSGRVYPLKLGFIGVVNRSQQDIQGNKSLTEALKAEQEFFKFHPAYRNMAHRCGTQFLAKSLNTTLMAHIRERLPDIKARLNTLMGQTQQELASYGDSQFQGREHRGSLVLQLMTRFATSFISSIDGTSSDISTKELCGGARIYYIFNSVFGNSLESIDPTTNLSTMDIRTAIRNSTGPRPSLFVPELAFDLLVKPQIRLLEIPSNRCVELVYEELIKICHTCGNAELSRFPRMQAKLIEVVSELLRERLGPTSHYVESLIAIQRAYINTNHPNFLGAAGAMSGVINSKQEKEKKQQAFDRRRERELRRKPGMSHSSPNLNGAVEAGEYDESAAGGEIQHPRRPASPAFSTIERPITSQSYINGRTTSPSGMSVTHPAGKASDTFLNYFFGKDGMGAGPSSSVPAARGPSLRAQRGIRDREDNYNTQIQQPQPRHIQQNSISNRSEFAFEQSRGGNDYEESQSFVRLYSSEYQNNANIYQQQQHGRDISPEEAALSERELMEVELIRRLISSYFNIVRETIADQVPKAIMHLLVNHSKDVVQNRLVSELYREEVFDDMLYEDDNIKAEREKCEKLLTTYKEAAKIVGEVL